MKIRKITKSEKIREILAETPDADLSAIAKKLNCTRGLVHLVMARMSAAQAATSPVPTTPEKGPTAIGTTADRDYEHVLTVRCLIESERIPPAARLNLIRRYLNESSQRT